MSNLDPFINQWAVLLTTFRRDGTAVGTPVSLAVDGERAFVRSPGTAWKVQRSNDRWSRPGIGPPHPSRRGNE